MASEFAPHNAAQSILQLSIWAIIDIHPIRDKQSYKAALKEISRLMETDPELGTSEGDRLDAMVNLVQTYEALHYPLS